jgi:hypothetical protein
LPETPEHTESADKEADSYIDIKLADVQEDM